MDATSVGFVRNCMSILGQNCWSMCA